MDVKSTSRVNVPYIFNLGRESVHSTGTASHRRRVKYRMRKSISDYDDEWCIPSTREQHALTDVCASVNGKMDMLEIHVVNDFYYVITHCNHGN